MTRGPELPPGLERDYPLARLTTIRTGGLAAWFARPQEISGLEGLLRWADESQIDIGVVGSGSNLLVADAGFAGLVLKLDGALARIDDEEHRLVCGGGARLPAAAARAASLGLAGLEFGVSIPGTVGRRGAHERERVRGELGRVLEWVEVCAPTGTYRRAPGDLGFEYRRSNIGPREVVARASFALERSDPESVKAVLADLRARRKEAQPSGIKTFGSTFKNPDDPRAEGRTAGQLLEAAGCKGLEVGGARFSPKHANFIENHRDATTNDVLRLIAEGRRRVRERFGVGLEPEVQLLGDIAVPSEAQA